jgi:hypothetical protein
VEERNITRTHGIWPNADKQGALALLQQFELLYGTDTIADAFLGIAQTQQIFYSVPV